MKRVKLFFAAAVMSLLGALSGSAQDITVQGKITDVNGEPVIGASIFVTGTTRGDITGTTGEFALTGIAEDEPLTISCIGMKTVETVAKPILNVVMEFDNQILDDVIVIAYGTATKESFTGSASVVKNDALEKKSLTNVVSGLQGEVAGLQMINNSGDPTAEPTMAIRGFSSINAGTSPLIVVDGAPYDGGLNSINPNDVESLTVLKDAASNALYGARGANGVIMITTKRASAGQAKFSLDAKWGINSRATQEYDYISNPGEYYEMFYKALYNYNVRDAGMSAYAAHVEANSQLGKTYGEHGLGYMIYTVPDGENLIGTNGKLNPHATMGNRVYDDGQVYTLYPDDWVDEAFRKSLRQEYNFNVSGGSDKISYYGSLGYLDNEGIVYNSDYERYTARFKTDYQAREWMKLGTSLNYAHTDYNEVADGSYSMFDMLTYMAPVYPLYIRDGEGNILTDENGKRYDYGTGENGGKERPSTLMPMSNPLQENILNMDHTIGNLTTVSGYMDITPIEGLKITINGTVTDDETDNTATGQPYYGETAKSYPGGYVYREKTQKFSMNFQQLVNYNKQIGLHNISAMVGHENYRYNYNYVYGSRSNMFSFETSQELDGAIKVITNSSVKTLYNTEGYFARAMYNYAEKYFFSASYRRDASSRFHPDHRWGNFFSVGGAWTVNKEDWYDIGWMDLLKIKASWGQQGNDSIGDYRYTDTYSLKNVNGEIAFEQATVGNENITWETNSNFNAGIEFDILKSRISGSIEYFRRKTTDMLSYVYVPLSAGYGGTYDNVGDMLNKGVELDLHFNILKGREFNWTVNLNATHFRNEILMLSEDNKGNNLEGHPGYINGYFFTGEGLPLHTFYLKKYAGVTEDGLSSWYVEDADGNVSTTTSFSNGSYYNCGTSDPDLYGGFSTTFSWRNLDFSATFNYSIGGKAIDYTYATLMTNPSSTSIGYGFHKDLLNAWSEDNRTSNIPRFQYAVQDADTYSAAISDRFLTNASYLTFQNFNIGYTLPRKWVEAVNLCNVRVYVQGDNLCYWSARKGFDPRGSFWGQSYSYNYAPVRTFSAGINIQF